jgi:hypothetical protein
MKRVIAVINQTKIKIFIYNIFMAQSCIRAVEGLSSEYI